MKLAPHYSWQGWRAAPAPSPSEASGDGTKGDKTACVPLIRSAKSQRDFRHQNQEQGAGAPMRRQE